MEPDSTPLTFGQEQLLHLGEFGEPGALARVLSIPVPDGPAVADVRSALSSVVRRHDALRMGIVSTAGGHRQITARNRRVEVIPEGGDPEAYGAFDLWTDAEEQPLFVSVDTRTTPPRVNVHLHHVLVDGWSAALILDDFHQHYDGHRAVAAATAPSFGAYALRQREAVTGAAMERHMRFWAEELAGAHPLRLPYAIAERRPAPSAAARPGLLFEVRDLSMAELLNASPESGRSGVTMMLAALAAAFSEATGQRDLLFSSDMTDRGTTTKRNTVGCLVNRVTLRVRLPREPGAGGAVRAARRAWARAARHQAGPFQYDGRTIPAGQILTASPRVNLAFNQDLLRKAASRVTARQTPRATAARGNAHCTIWDTSGPSGEDLQILVAPGRPGSPISFSLTYRPEVWTAEGVERLGTAMARWLRTEAAS